jgi:hypothetical protein
MNRTKSTRQWLTPTQHRVGLLVLPPPWVGVTREVRVEEDGRESVAYQPAHVSLFFLVARAAGDGR